jgi:hypothetical protein
MFLVTMSKITMTAMIVTIAQSVIILPDRNCEFMLSPLQIGLVKT